jgi:predicted acyltransferase
MVASPIKGSSAVRQRLGSIDAYRGLVMLLILAEVLRSCAVAAALPDWRIWSYVCSQQSHVPWVGFSLHDLIQPSFYFLVGISVVFSLARRLTEGQSHGRLLLHTLIRSSILIVLGMALFSIHPRVWKWQFIDTLTQIGLAYPFLVLIALRPRREWYFAATAILTAYWLWFALSPTPVRPGEVIGVSASWIHEHGLEGFAAHWQKNANPAYEFDLWFLNLFPGEIPYSGDVAGVTTLNFVPSIATMILGSIAGDLLRRRHGQVTLLPMFVAIGTGLIGAGWMLHAIGVVPVVKAIWTPSWVLFSGGWCFLFLATFYAVVDLGGVRRAVFPLTVIGMNSLVAYSMSHVYPAVAFNSLRRIVGWGAFRMAGDAYEPLVYGCAVLACYWLVLFALYKLRIFVRI